jgi:polyphosphate kinase
LGISAQQLVKDITKIVIDDQTESLVILKKIETELESENIFIINEISVEQEIYLKDFLQKLSPELVTIILNDLSEFPLLRDNMGYLAIKLVMKKTQKFDMLLLKFRKR